MERPVTTAATGFCKQKIPPLDESGGIVKKA